MKPTFLPTYETLVTVVKFVPVVTVVIFVTEVTVETKKIGDRNCLTKTL